MKIQDFSLRKQQKQKISMLTCYDYTFACMLNESPVDCLLVGDSAAMVMHGHNTTLKISVEMMAWHTEAVSKGANNKFIVGDMPFLSYRKGLSENMDAVQKIMCAGAHAIKLEGAKGNIDLVHHIVESGVPVMGHLGLTPQSIHQLGGFKVQGKNNKEYQQILQDSLALQEAGCFAVVLECVPTLLAKEISEQLTIPTIGIGAGPYTDGQVLVLQDMLGMGKTFKPKFLRTYAQGFQMFQDAFKEFHDDVTQGSFPSEKESYL